MRALYRSVTAAAAMFLLPAAASRAQEAEVPQPPPQQPAACLTIAPVCALKPARRGVLSYWNEIEQSYLNECWAKRDGGVVIHTGECHEPAQPENLIQKVSLK
jgi:hypothetical protein